MADTTDLLGHAFEKSPVDFADTFNQLMQQKTMDAIEAHRVTLAQSIYGEAEEPDVDADDGFEDDDVGEDEFDLDDDELDDFEDEDDLDLDLDDLDLEDLDLEDEDFTDDEDA